MYQSFGLNFISINYYFPLISKRLWATDHYQPLRIFAGHLADVNCTRFHPNSNYVATGSADRTVRLWDVLNGNCVRIFTGHKVSYTFLIPAHTDPFRVKIVTSSMHTLKIVFMPLNYSSVLALSDILNLILVFSRDQFIP